MKKLLAKKGGVLWEGGWCSVSDDQFILQNLIRGIGKMKTLQVGEERVFFGIVGPLSHHFFRLHPSPLSPLPPFFSPSPYLFLFPFLRLILIGTEIQKKKNPHPCVTNVHTLKFGNRTGGKEQTKKRDMARVFFLVWKMLARFFVAWINTMYIGEKEGE